MVSTDERREEMIRILISGSRTTVPKLATQLGVSERTIYRIPRPFGTYC